MEKEVERMAMRTQKELVLLHKEGCERPNNTVTWLNMRNWISSHHHILCNKRMFSRRSQYRIVSIETKGILFNIKTRCILMFLCCGELNIRTNWDQGGRIINLFR